MKVLAVIPTYNERDNLPDLVRAVLADPSFAVMVVDDGSPDGTGELADGLAREFPGRVDVVHRTGKRGLGRSYVEGLQRALATSDADLICQMDADWSHDPKYLPSMVDACASHDVVIGSLPSGLWQLSQSSLRESRSALGSRCSSIGSRSA